MAIPPTVDLFERRQLPAVRPSHPTATGCWLDRVMWVRTLGLLAVAMLLVVVLLAPRALARGTEAWWRVSLPNSPSLVFPTSGFWDTAFGLRILDPLSRLLLRADLESRAMAERSLAFDAAAGLLPEYYFPVLLRERAGESFLEVTLTSSDSSPEIPPSRGEYARILRLDPSLRIAETITLQSGKEGQSTQTVRRSPRVVGLYDWQPAGSSFLAFVDIRRPLGASQEEKFSAFALLDESGELLKVLSEPLANTSAKRLFYVHSRDYICVTPSGRGYYLDVTTDPKQSAAVVEVDLASLETRSHMLGPSLRGTILGLDGLATTIGARQATYVYQGIERSTGPVFLFQHDDALFLVTKTALAETRPTSWYLHALVSKAEGLRIERSVPIPTAAPNLLVIAGTSWAVLEKGEAQGIGNAHAPYMPPRSLLVLEPPFFSSLRSGS